MLPAKRLLDEVINSIRTVIAPAISDPFPKSQAFMAAVILEFVSTQVTERTDIESAKHDALDSLFTDLMKLLNRSELDGVDKADPEARLSSLIENLYEQREKLGEQIFNDANGRIRRALRQLLDQDLKVAKRD